MSEEFDKTRLWNDITQYAQNRINTNDTEMYTNSQRKRFWLKTVTNAYIRIEREDSKMPYEDIPKIDFIDIWTDMNKNRYKLNGYMQKDLHGGQNRHTAVTYSLISKQKYIEIKKVGRGLKFYIDELKL